MYSFIPRLATQEAWDNKMFNDVKNLDEVVNAMKVKRCFFQGDIMLGFWPWKRRIPFRTVRELKEKIDEFSKNETISRVNIYTVGYFVLNNPVPVGLNTTR